MYQVVWLHCHRLISLKQNLQSTEFLFQPLSSITTEACRTAHELNSQHTPYYRGTLWFERGEPNQHFPINRNSFDCRVYLLESIFLKGLIQKNKSYSPKHLPNSGSISLGRKKSQAPYSSSPERTTDSKFYFFKLSTEVLKHFLISMLLNLCKSLPYPIKSFSVLEIH